MSLISAGSISLDSTFKFLTYCIQKWKYIILSSLCFLKMEIYNSLQGNIFILRSLFFTSKRLMTVLRGKRKFIVLNTQIQLYKGVYSSHQKDLLLFSDVQLHLIYIFLEMENKNCLWTHFKLTSNFVFPMQINQVPFTEYVVHSDYTVSWWIRKLSCIEEVPRFFFFIQFKIKLKNLNWLQLKLNRELI